MPVLLSQGGIKVDENVNISGWGFIISQEHYVHSPGLEKTLEKIVIEGFIWLATNVTNLTGVCTGRGALVAAGAVATKDALEHTIVAGFPASEIDMPPDKFKYHTYDDNGLKWL
jgi:acetyltransferase-like isoleucine patch superfamily enzyme